MSERPRHVTALKRRIHALVATPIHAIASHHNDLRAKYILTCEILYDGKDFVQQHEITAATPDSTPGAAKHIPRVRTDTRTDATTPRAPPSARCCCAHVSFPSTSPTHVWMA